VSGAPAVALALALFAGDDAPKGDAVEKVASKVAELGPVRAWVELAPGRPRLSDQPKLTLVIDAAEGVAVEKPPFGDDFSGFAIRDFRDALPESKDGRRVLKQVYTLEPSASGHHVILPIPIRFKDGRANGDAQEHVLETEALAVDVTSVVGAELPDLGSLAQGEGPIAVPWKMPAWLAAALGGAVALVAAAVGFVAWRRSRVPPKPLSSMEIAQRELDALLARDRERRLDVKSFYVELTAIVRRHVERTTGVHAPEQTTPEFLRAIQGHPAFDELRRERLRAFLEAADLVKFAGFEPERAAVDASVERAREFIRLFSPRSVEPAPAGAGP
jgi:hypothetical protein